MDEMSQLFSRRIEDLLHREWKIDDLLAEQFVRPQYPDVIYSVDSNAEYQRVRRAFMDARERVRIPIRRAYLEKATMVWKEFTCRLNSVMGRICKKRSDIAELLNGVKSHSESLAESGHARIREISDKSDSATKNIIVAATQVGLNLIVQEGEKVMLRMQDELQLLKYEQEIVTEAYEGELGELTRKYADSCAVALECVNAEFCVPTNVASS